MKKTFAGIIASFAVALVAYGQGQVDFRNSATALGTAQPVFDQNGVPLSGTAYLCNIYYSTTGIGGTYASITAPAVAFRTGTGVGIWNWGAVATRDILGTFGGQTVHLMIRAWTSAHGSTFEQASSNPLAFVGSSNPFAYSLGGVPNGGGTSIIAPAMAGFTSFNLAPVPEPSTIALGVLGATALFALRRRKQ